jgi:replication factor C subunit 3/5
MATEEEEDPLLNKALSSRTHVCIPWIEKYRPTQFADIVLEPNNRRFFENIIQGRSPSFPNLLLYGPPGTGKTTSVINLVAEYQRRHSPSGNNLSSNVIHLNASDERGIDIIRNQINLFIKSQHLFEAGLKFVVLDEVDYMTKSAQQALKYILQTYTSNNVRFFLICNYISKIDESLQKEFLTVQFSQLPKPEIRQFLMRICRLEDIAMTEGKIGKIMALYNDDIRGMIKFIQLNQDKVLDQAVWETMDELFTASTGVGPFIDHVGDHYNMEKKQIVHHYLEHIFLRHLDRVDTAFIDFVELVVHNLENEVLIPFFIHYMTKWWNGAR